MRHALLKSLPGFLREFWWFGIKQACACAFAGSFFAVLFLSNHLPLGGLARYDFLFLAALGLQVGLVGLGLESWREVKAISLFHALGLLLELFKTHPAIGSWSYPEPGVLKLWGVPLYSGFMYAAVASYMIQSWRLLDLKLSGYPSAWLGWPLGVAVYLNFFTHHFLWDLRWPLAALTLAIFWRTRVHYTPRRTRLWMPLPLSFVLIGFFVWLAENIATLFRAWTYPNQQDAWAVVHWGKISSWALLVIMSFIIVAGLKRVAAGQDARGPAPSDEAPPVVHRVRADG